MANEKIHRLWDGIVSLQKYWIGIGGLLFFIGIICVSVNSSTSSMNCPPPKPPIFTKKSYEHIFSIDYSNCTTNDGSANETCLEVINSSNGQCSCILKDEVVIPRNVTGDVVLMYKLDTFNETVASLYPNFYQSRDENQLSGNLTDKHSDSCKPFALNNITKKPIVPCGAIAEYMFNDEISIFNIKYLPFEPTGIIETEDKKGFRNPSQDNLTLAFANYSKPTGWSEDQWKYFCENDGLENEAFIAWMRTDWVEKPLKILNRTEEPYKQGLPKGNYSVSIHYRYRFYDGRRTLIIAKVIPPEEIKRESGPCIETITSNSAAKDVGIALLILGIFFLIIALVPFILDQLKKRGLFFNKKTESSGEPTNVPVSPPSKETVNKRDVENQPLNDPPKKTEKIQGQKPLQEDNDADDYL